MFIRCVRLMEGPGPSEAIVSVSTAEGKKEEVVVYTGLLKNGYLEVGPLLITHDRRSLIELPREAASGRRRIWISESDVVREDASA